MRKRYRAFIAVACGVGLLACNDEGLTGSGQGDWDGIPAVEGGRYVVDYTLGNGILSRVDEEGDGETVQSSPVRSLTYLLYENTGTDESGNKVYMLMKRREIRDISENTKWPLKRDNMTWNQREDLKDTLDRSNEYKVVFVANSAASLHDGEEVLITSQKVETPEEDEESQETLSDFTDAYLKMPQTAFTDDNLFYVVCRDFSVEDLTENTDYVSLSLTLERVVARTELTCAAAPDKTELTTRLQNSLYKELEEGTGTSTDAEWTIGKQVKNNLTPLLEEDVYEDYEKYTITVSNGDGIETTESCGDKLRELLQGLTLPEEDVEKLKKEIIPQLYRGLVIDPLMLDYQNPFLLQYNWKSVNTVKVNFESRTNKVGLDGKYYIPVEEEKAGQLTVPVKEDGTVHLTTFGTAKVTSTEGEVMSEQVIHSLEFYPEQVAETEPKSVFTITCQDQYPLKLDLAANQRISLELDPAVQILPENGWYPTDKNPGEYVDVSVTVNLEEILGLEAIFADMQPPTSIGDISSEGDNLTQGDETGNSTDTSNGYYENFKEQINSVIKTEGLGDINNFKITVKIPDTSKPETYTCVPGWRQVVDTPSGNE